MAFSFGDGFDCYAAPADAINGYWDSGPQVTSLTLAAGRFAGSQAIVAGSGSGVVVLAKSSGQNDAAHHLVVAFRQTSAISGSTSFFTLQLLDGTTAQCTLVFRSDGAILLTSGVAGGTVLDTYSGAFPVASTWYAFEFEIVINNTTGSWAVRKNGNTSNDRALGSLNTRGGTANNYANKLQVGWSSAPTGGQQMDDLFWQSGAATGAWMGDIRCYTRMPASDATVQFSRSTGATNFSCVDETQQNTTTDYVFDSTVGHADFYGISALSPTPATVIAVTTRGYVQKSDAGSRTATVQLKSGATTVAAPTLTLTTSGWLWAWRTDTTNPATSGTWTNTAVDAVTVGPVVIS